MKLFGEYLVEKGLLKNSQLLESVMEQIITSPSIQQIVYENKMIDEINLLQVLKYQHQNNIDFVSACKAFKIWTKEFETQITNHINNGRLPIGKILLKKSYITLEQLTQSLQEYFALTPKEASLFNFENTHKPETLAVQAMTEYFSEQKKNELLKLFNQDNVDVIKSKTELLKLKSVFRLVKSNAAELLINKVLDQIATNKPNLKEMFLKLINHLWNAREIINKEGVDELWWSKNKVEIVQFYFSDIDENNQRESA